MISEGYELRHVSGMWVRLQLQGLCAYGVVIGE